MHSNRFFQCSLALLTSWVSVAAVQAQSGSRSSAPSISPGAYRARVEANQPPVVRGAVVVELFTSQGCSSCPSADAALLQIATTAQKSKLPVYVLSFHVDYWNRLGWTDPYSDPAFTARQRIYASATQTKRVYTPQMIVGGVAEFVGSDKAKAHSAITKALAQQNQNKLDLSVGQSTAGDSLAINYQIQGPITGKVLHVALVQSPSPNKVPRGENSGRELRHVNVVRALQTVDLSEASGEAVVKLPENVSATQVSVIGYVQNAKTFAISGAGTVQP